MFKRTRYVHKLLILCISSIIIYVIFTTSPSSFDKIIKKISIGHRKQMPETLVKPSAWRNFTNDQFSKITSLGKWLLSSEESLPPLIINVKKEPYLILIWKHGQFLERRHIKRFTNNKFSPWENCSVKNCTLSYQLKDLEIADAVIFHLHQMKTVMELPTKIHRNQRWIFLTDESPMHTFLYGNQNLSSYNGLFNWSMSYRIDSDVPVPYGRVIFKSPKNVRDAHFLKDTIKKLKTKLVTIMGSNCGGTNDRWNYVSELKYLLGNDLDLYGTCLNGNRTACPGHFAQDCPILNSYKFYLAFENSNCREYITEKVFWNGYHKFAIPIIMGAPKKDCERLLPPHSFLHVTDFANPAALANYIQYLNRHDDKYFEYHEWRRYYKVVNEHGYFGSISKHYCRICEALHYNSPAIKIYENMEGFLNRKRDCTP